MLVEDRVLHRLPNQSRRSGETRNRPAPFRLKGRSYPPRSAQRNHVQRDAFVDVQGDDSLHDQVTNVVGIIDVGDRQQVDRCLEAETECVSGPDGSNHDCPAEHLPSRG